MRKYLWLVVYIDDEILSTETSLLAVTDETGSAEIEFLCQRLEVLFQDFL